MSSFENSSRCALDVTMKEPTAIVPRRISSSLSNIFMMFLHVSNPYLQLHLTTKHLVGMLKGLAIDPERKIHLARKDLVDFS
jgi:hypothetical protein